MEFDVPRGEVPVEYFGDAIVAIGDIAVERHGHDCDDVRHYDVSLRGMETAFNVTVSQDASQIRSGGTDADLEVVGLNVR